MNLQRRKMRPRILSIGIENVHYLWQGYAKFTLKKGREGYGSNTLAKGVSSASFDAKNFQKKSKN